MTSGLFNCYESAADVRSTDEDTWLSRQKLSCSFCYFRTLSFPACMACYGIARAKRNADLSVNNILVIIVIIVIDDAKWKNKLL